MIKIAVTGASGFLGNSIIKTLNNLNVYVIAIARSRNSSNLMNLKNGKWLFLDIHKNCDDYFLKIESPDILIHLAWDNLYDYNLLYHQEVELVFQYKFLKNLVSNGLKNIVISGTCLEYGLNNGVQIESDVVVPNTVYGLAKDSLRKQLEFLQSSIEFNLVWARIFYLFGENQRESSLFKQMIKAKESNIKSFKMSQGDQIRDFIHVDCAANIISKLSMFQRNLGVVNISSGRPISVRSFVESFFEVNNHSIKLDLGYYPYNDYEPFAFWGSNLKLNSLLFNDNHLD
jgi:nucleoside-diphosphate-sugar epimerase